MIKTGAQLEAADFDTSTTGCGVIDVPPAQRAIAVQVDQVSGVGTVINTADFVDMLVGFTGDKFPVVTLNPADDSITVVAGLNGTSVKLLLEGMQVLCRQLPPVAAPANGEATPPPSGGGTTSLNGQQEIVMLGSPRARPRSSSSAQLDGSISLVLRSTGGLPRRGRATRSTPPPSGDRRHHPQEAHHRLRGSDPGARGSRPPGPGHQAVADHASHRGSTMTLAARRARRTSGPAPVRHSGAERSDHRPTNEMNRTH